MPTYAIFKADLAKEKKYMYFPTIFFLIRKNPIFSTVTCELKTFPPPCLGKNDLILPLIPPFLVPVLQ